MREALAKPPASVLQAPYSEARIQNSVFSIQNGNPLTGNVFSYSDSCILTPDFSLANTPKGFYKRISLFVLARPPIKAVNCTPL